jgi:hypothetical protein
MSVQLDDYCVYTIAIPERLLEASKSQMPLHERKRWVGAAEHLRNAKNAGRELPIVFADARDCSKLIAWSVLRSVAVGPKETHYTIGQLWAVHRSSPQDLRLLSSKKHIAEGFIRPYALCQTPDFLHIESKKPRAWLQRGTTIREVREGERRLVAHMRLERNRGIVNELKKQRMQHHNGRLPCEICGFDFLEAYGPVGAGFAEAHHKKSLAGSPKGGRVTSLHDFVVVCANCHRMLHRTPELPSVELLKKRVRSSAKKTQQGAPGDAKKRRA